MTKTIKICDKCNKEIEYISKYELELRIENALDNAKAVEMNEYRYGVVKGLEIAKDIIDEFHETK